MFGPFSDYLIGHPLTLQTAATVVLTNYNFFLAAGLYTGYNLTHVDYTTEKA